MAEAPDEAVGLILQTPSGKNNPMQEVDSMRMQERASGRVSHKQQGGAMGQRVAGRDTIARHLGGMEWWRWGPGASESSKGAEKVRSRAYARPPGVVTSSSACLVTPRSNVDQLLRSHRPARATEEGPDVAHGIMASLMGAIGAGMDMCPVWVERMHAGSAGCHGDILATSRHRKQWEAAVDNDSMSADGPDA